MPYTRAIFVPQNRKRDEDKTPHLFIRRENIEGNICWVLCWTAVRTQLMTLTKSVWSMCGSLVGGVGPKMKSCYLLRVKQRLAFCCPLLPNKLFFVFWEVRLLPGVLRFPHVMVIFAKSTHVCAICVQTCFISTPNSSLKDYSLLF